MELYCSALGFYNSMNLNCFGALSFLKICSHIFMILKSNWSSDFGHAETGGERKSELFCGVKFFRPKFKVE